MVLLGSTSKKQAEGVSFRMGLEGRVDIYEEEKGKEILGRRKNS